MEDYAYISLLGSNSYIYAAIAMMYSGKNTNSKYPFYLLVTENITEENIKIVKALGYKLIFVQEYKPKKYLTMKEQIELDEDTLNWHGKDGEDRGGQHAFTKMLIFGLTQVKKWCFLDLDILFLHNLDYVFKYPHLSSVRGDKQDTPINSILIIIEPNTTEYEALMNFAEHAQSPSEHLKLLEDYWIINDFYQKTHCHNRNIPMTACYDFLTCSTMNSYLPLDFMEMSTIHMSGQEKPGTSGSNFVAGGSREGYLARFLGLYYIEICNMGIRDLKQKQIADIPYIN